VNHFSPSNDYEHLSAIHTKADSTHLA